MQSISNNKNTKAITEKLPNTNLNPFSDPRSIRYYLDHSKGFIEMLKLINESDGSFIKALSEADYLEVANLHNNLNVIRELLQSNEVRSFEHSSHQALSTNSEVQNGKK